MPCHRKLGCFFFLEVYIGVILSSTSVNCYLGLVLLLDIVSSLTGIAHKDMFSRSLMTEPVISPRSLVCACYNADVIEVTNLHRYIR